MIETVDNPSKNAHNDSQPPVSVRLEGAKLREAKQKYDRDMKTRRGLLMQVDAIESEYGIQKTCPHCGRSTRQ